MCKDDDVRVGRREESGESTEARPGLRRRPVFGGRTLTFEDLRQRHNEPRYLTAGTLVGRMVIIAHTQRGDATRIISMRKANARERARYQERLGESR